MRAIPFDAIRAAALAQAEQLLRDWFPRGKRVGREFKVGNLQGDAGESLCINLDTGLWADFAEGAKGHDLIDLRGAMMRTDRVAAAKDLAETLGISIANGHAKPNGHDKTAPDFVAAYVYKDADGAVLYEVVRFTPKTFRQRRPDGNGGWTWSVKGVQRVPYRLPELLAGNPAELVFIVEGEKDVDNLHNLGLIATCNPGGASKWEPHLSEHLRGRHVVILPDNDQAGRDHADDVRRKLTSYAASVRVLTLPHLPEKADVSDWIAAGGTAELLLDMLSVADDEDTEHEQNKEDPEPAENWHAGGDDIAVLIAEFNKKYMVVNENGKAIVYQPGFNPVLRRRKFDRITFEDLKRLYLNRKVEVGRDEKGNPVRANVAHVWLTHPSRRQYIGGVVFDPSGTADRDTLNLWEGFSVSSKKGDWSLLRNHVWTVICGCDQVRFDYLMKWMGRLIQQPAEQGEVAVVMRGKEGTGKGTLANALIHILGKHGLGISNAKHLVGNFNGHLRDVVLLFADEAFFAGDRAHVGVLKSIITEPYLTVEAKYQNAVQMPNFLHLMMASNEQWVVPASLEARRFFVLEISDEHRDDHAYFGAIRQQLNAGGCEAMLHELQNIDLTGFNVRRVPVTEGLQRQRQLSLDASHAWWLDVLHRGHVWKSKLGLEEYFAKWVESASTELLFSSYSDFANGRRERHPMSRETFGRFMNEMGAKAGRLYKSAAGEHITDADNGFGVSVAPTAPGPEA